MPITNIFSVLQSTIVPSLTTAPINVESMPTAQKQTIETLQQLATQALSRNYPSLKQSPDHPHKFLVSTRVIDRIHQTETFVDHPLEVYSDGRCRFEDETIDTQDIVERLKGKTSFIQDVESLDLVAETLCMQLKEPKDMKVLAHFLAQYKNRADRKALLTKVLKRHEKLASWVLRNHQWTPPLVISLWERVVRAVYWIFGWQRGIFNDLSPLFNEILSDEKVRKDIRSLDFSYRFSSKWDPLTDDDVLSIVTLFPNLTSLNLSGNRKIGVKDWGLISNVHYSIGLTSKIIIHLQKLSKLQKLDISNLKEGFYLVDFKDLTKLPNLEELNIENTAWFDNVLSSLSELSKLKKLTLSNSLLTSRGINNKEKHSLSALRNLTSFKCITSIGRLGIDACFLRELPRSVELELKLIYSWDLDYDTNTTIFPSLGRFNNVTSLDLSGYVDLTHLGPLQELSRLTSLDLSGCSALRDEGLSPLYNMPSLRQINLQGCPRITQEEIARLRDALPQCQIFQG